MSRHIALPILFFSVVCIAQLPAQVSVLTYHNDNARDGLNSHETILTPANVNASGFGQMFNYPVDGQIYAQPLYLPGVAIAGNGTHNVVFVATQNDSVYAFDADSNAGANAGPLWQVAFTNPAAGITAVSASDVNCGDISPQIGITGTPVIDAAAGTLYLVAKTKEISGATVKFVQRLHALDVTSGAEKFGGPFTIPAVSAPGTCFPNGNGRVHFNALMQNQRAGLVLAPDGILYITWASYCDNDPYTGWLMAFHAKTGKLMRTFNTAPNQGTAANECRGGIWQGGAAPALDAAGDLFFATGNGYFNADSGGSDYGDSQIKLKLGASGFSVLDYFTPSDQANIDAADTDLGSGGVLLLPQQAGPNKQLLVQAGKEGTIYLVNRSNMSHFNAAGDQVVQELPNAIGGVWGMPAYFNHQVYFGGQYDSLKAFQLTKGLFAASPASQSANAYQYPGPTPSVSANGTTNGIVWALDASAWGSSGPGVLHAYDATNLAHELYNSAQVAARDQLGPAVKFSVPTIANGKVYVGTGNSLAVFGILPVGSDFRLSASPASATLPPGGSDNYQVNVLGAPGFVFNGAVTFSVGGLPSGVIGNFSPATMTGEGAGTLTVSAPGDAPAGTYSVTITGTSGAITHSVSVNLVVGSLGVISINFMGYGPSLAPGDVAGVVPKSNWNNLTASSSSTPVILFDEFGNGTSAGVTWMGNSPWILPIPNSSADYAMMQGYLDDPDGSTTTVSVSGLFADANGYLVYVYADGDNGSATHNSQYSLGGVTLQLSDLPGANFSGAYLAVTADNPDGNYMVFSVPGTSFTLTASPVSGSDGLLRAPINGIQIVPQ